MLSGRSDTALATAAGVAIYLRRGPASDKQASRCADHEIERRIVEGGKTIAAAIGNSEPKAGPLEANAKREADMLIVINNQKATHTAAHALSLAFDSPRLRFAPTLIAL